MSKATDVRYGRQGGRIVPILPAESEALFAAALAAGDVVYVRCACARWWVASNDVGRPCDKCSEPMKPEARAA